MCLSVFCSIIWMKVVWVKSGSPLILLINGWSPFHHLCTEVVCHQDPKKGNISFYLQWTNKPIKPKQSNNNDYITISFVFQVPLEEKEHLHLKSTFLRMLLFKKWSVSLTAYKPLISLSVLTGQYLWTCASPSYPIYFLALRPQWILSHSWCWIMKVEFKTKLNKNP